jgi:hypothetical protein
MKRKELIDNLDWWNPYEDEASYFLRLQYESTLHDRIAQAQNDILSRLEELWEPYQPLGTERRKPGCGW